MTGEMSGKNPDAEARAPYYLFVCVSRSPAPALEVTGSLDKDKRRVRRSGYDLGAGSTKGCDGRINERGGVFCQPFPSYFGKNEVTWELD
jgi:hypothetical protein